jgi:hypothetical protein
MSQFYTYQYLRTKDGTFPVGSPYYVGKGKGRRAWTSRIGHRPPKDLTLIRIQYWPDELTASAYEIYLIDFWGRVSLGTGCLRNNTDGGDGTTRKSPEGCKRIGEANSRRIWSKESLQKKREAYRRWASTTKHPLQGKKNSKLSEYLKKHPRTGSSNPNFGNHKLAGPNHPMFGKKRPDVAQRNKEQARPLAPEHRAKIAKALLGNTNHPKRVKNND